MTVVTPGIDGRAGTGEVERECRTIRLPIPAGAIPLVLTDWRSGAETGLTWMHRLPVPRQSKRQPPCRALRGAPNKIRTRAAALKARDSQYHHEPRRTFVQVKGGKHIRWVRPVRLVLPS